MERYAIIGLRGKHEIILLLRPESVSNKEFINTSNDNVGYDRYKLVKYIGSLQNKTELINLSKDEIFACSSLTK